MGPPELRAELFKQFDVGQQFILYVRMQVAVLGDEIVVEISFPLHLCSMHYNNYIVKCVYGGQRLEAVVHHLGFGLTQTV